MELAEGMKDSVPCTACRYCCDDCAQGLDIPNLLGLYNQARFDPTINVGMTVEALPLAKQPAACLACGKCNQMCPQNIDVQASMLAFSEILSKIPKWADLSKQREALFSSLREKKA
jgi:predicted aldo/keto reductase-like oxidoreductase